MADTKKSGIEVKIAGIVYTGWESITVSQSMLAYCGEATLTVNADFSSPPKQKSTGSFVQNPTDISKINLNQHFNLDDPIIISVFGVPILKGYIYQMNVSYDANGYSVEYIARDKTADLVDSGIYAETTKTEMLSTSVMSIISILLGQFGITSVVNDPILQSELSNPAKKNPEFRIEIGSPIKDNINKLLIPFGAYAYSNGDGTLIIARDTEFSQKRKITEVNQNIPRLQTGVNILSASCNQSNVDLFRKYVVYANGYNPNSEVTEKGDAEYSFDIFSSDRNRTINIVDDTIINADDCKKRAETEARQRIGAARKFEVTVAGWDYKINPSDYGKPWKINQLVMYDDWIFGQQTEKLIVQIDYSLDSSSGETVRLTLVNPNTFVISGKPIKKDDAETLLEKIDAYRAQRNSHESSRGH